MIDKDKIKKIRLAKKEEEINRELEKLRVEKDMELDALKKQVEKLNKKLVTAQTELVKIEIQEEKSK